MQDALLAMYPDMDMSESASSESDSSDSGIDPTGLRPAMIALLPRLLTEIVLSSDRFGRPPVEV